MESQLIRRYRESRDREALDTLMTRHYPAVYRVVLNLVHNDADAADLSQATFLRVLQSPSEFDGRGSFRAWLMQIAVNEVRQHWRRGRRRPAPDPLFDAYVEGRRGERAVEDEVSHREFEQALSNALESLPEHLKIPLVLHYYERMALAEIGASLGLSKSTVQSRCNRAVARLRRRFARRGQHVLLPIFAKQFPGLRAATARTYASATIGLTGLGLLVLGAIALWFADRLPFEERLRDWITTADPDRNESPATSGSRALTPQPTRVASLAPDGEPESVTRDVHTTGPGSLTGAFLLEPEFRPLAGARVTVSMSHHHRNDYRGEGDKIWFVNTYPTDANGRFVCDALPLDKVYDIYLEHRDSSYRQVRRVWFPEGIDHVELGTVVGDAPMTLTGNVVDPAGHAVAGARITVGDHRREPGLLEFGYPASPLRGSVTHSDEFGQFTCEGLSAGFHRIFAHKSGFAACVLGALRVDPGDPTTRSVRLELGHPHELTGSVVDAAGSKVGGATIRLQRDETAVLGETGYSSCRNVAQRSSDADGRFTFHDLGAGNYVLEAEFDGRRSSRVRWMPSGDSGSEGNLRLKLDGSPTSPAGSLRIVGRVVSMDGPLFDESTETSQARIVLRSSEGFDRVSAPDGRGRFTIDRVSAGKYEVRAEIPGFLSEVRTIDVRSDHDVGGITLSRGSTLRGRITDAASGRPVLGGTVRYLDRCTVRAAVDGSFAIRGIPPGSRTVIGALSIHAPGYQSRPATIRPPRDLGERSGRWLQEFALHPTSAAAELRGKVVEPEGRTLPGVVVTVWFFLDNTMTQRSTRTNRDGTFRFLGLPTDFREHECTLGLRRVGFAPARLSLSSSTQLDGLVMHRGREVRGRVVDHEGRPVPMARVGSFASIGATRMPSTDHQPEQTVRCDQRGRFAFHNLPEGDRVLLPAAAGYRVAPGSVPAAFLAGQHRQDDLRLELQRGETIRGRIVDKDGRALAGALIFAAGVRTGAVLSDAQGRFVVRGVFVDTVDLRCRHGGKVVCEQKEVAAGTMDVLLRAR